MYILLRRRIVIRFYSTRKHKISRQGAQNLVFALGMF